MVIFRESIDRIRLIEAANQEERGFKAMIARNNTVIAQVFNAKIVYF